MMVDRDSTSWQIQARLAARKMSRNAFADKAGVSARTLYLSMAGRQDFTLDVLVKCAKYFGCTMEDLLQPIPSDYQ